MAQRYASSTTPLQANGAANGADTWSDTLEAGAADSIVGMVFSNQPGTLFIEQSMDLGQNYDISTSYAIAGGDGKGFSEPILGSTIRVKFVNGAASAQTAFRIRARLSSAGPRP